MRSRKHCGTRRARLEGAHGVRPCACAQGRAARGEECTPRRAVDAQLAERVNRSSWWSPGWLPASPRHRADARVCGSPQGPCRLGRVHKEGVHRRSRWRRPRDGYPAARYTDASCALRARAAQFPSRGRLHLLRRGTPSLWDPSQLGRSLGDPTLWRVRPDAEVTLEANPGTTDEEHSRRSASWASTGSPSACSPSPRAARRLGRKHTGRTPCALPDRARRRFRNVSLDLIHGASGRRRSWRPATRVRGGLGPSTSPVTPDPDRACEECPWRSAATRELTLPDDEVVSDMAMRALGAGQGAMAVRDQQLRPARARGRHNSLYVARRGVRRGRLRRVRLLARGRRGLRFANDRSPERYMSAWSARNRRVIVRTRLARGAPARAECSPACAGRRNRPRLPWSAISTFPSATGTLADPAHRERRLGSFDAPCCA